MSSDSELLVGLTTMNWRRWQTACWLLQAQRRLDDLLERNVEKRLAADEHLELDRLLTRVDQLTILKTRARYTLRQQAGAVRA